jgi:hypothetical protein
MRWFGLLLLGPLAAMAQTAESPALVRGVLLERDAQAAGGEFSVRTGTNLVFRYRFDRNTYVEREEQLIDVARLAPGEKVEVVSDVVPESVLRYARTIHVMADSPPPRPASARRVPAPPALTGNLTFSGLVFRLNAGRLVLRMREGVRQTLLLRPDTRFVQDGESVEAQALAAGTRVFVVAGRDVWDQVEAYQVIWGRILAPR